MEKGDGGRRGLEFQDLGAAAKLFATLAHLLFLVHSWIDFP